MRCGKNLPHRFSKPSSRDDDSLFRLRWRRITAFFHCDSTLAASPIGSMKLIPLPAILKLLGSLPLPTLLAGVLVCVSGCRKEEISVYQIPKGSEEMTPMDGATRPPAQAQHGSMNSPVPEMQYTLPAGWSKAKSQGSSVVALSIAEGKGEVSVKSFPGEGASQLNLINIVRMNAGLPALSDQELPKLIESVQVGDAKGSLIDFSAAMKTDGQKASGNISLAVATHGGATWFFKMTGDSETVMNQKNAFKEFLQSVHFSSANSPTSLPAGHIALGGTETALPAMGSEIPASPTAATAGNRPAWVTPTNWVEKPPTQMLLAKYSIVNGEASADVTISFFPGDVGGTLANVNRWRGMVGLHAIGGEDLDKTTESLDVPGIKPIIVDVSGNSTKTGRPNRLVGVIWPREGQTWFYKLMGDSALVDKEKLPFKQFVQSVRY